MKKLTAKQATERLFRLPEWSRLGDSIQRTYDFPDFVRSMAFVNRVAERAEAIQHHPDILVRYGKVTLTLSTHDAGGLTAKDFELAADCDGFLGA
jgi:4a-hydroxytetrahydrobiopterin dehydratase